MTDPSTDIDILIGRRLRERRLALGLSLKDLGEIVKVASQQISRYERGEHRVYASKLFEISDALGVPIGFFFDGLQDVDDQFQRELLEITKVYRQIPDASLRKRLRDLVRTLGAEQE